jgi:hypothetical protein
MIRWIPIMARMTATLPPNVLAMAPGHPTSVSRLPMDAPGVSSMNVALPTEAPDPPLMDTSHINGGSGDITD